MTLTVMFGERLRRRPISLPACASAVARRSGTARRACPDISANRMASGWVLVGDASYNRDPITAQGISDAFTDAEAVVAALSAGLSDTGVFDEPLPAHEAARDERVRPMYEFTTHLAALESPPPDMQALVGALRGNQDATNAFLSAITGGIPLPDFMSTENIGPIMAAANEAHTSSARTT
jgi:2-polyprenyl-6-methoxyphenol hydroxylase-like FAD-dependent oxidoreductase